MASGPKYPIYIISKGRYDKTLTADNLQKSGLDYHIAVEPQEYDLYCQKYGNDPKKKLLKAKMLEQVWPQYAKTVIRFSRIHHFVDWKVFSKQN